MNIYKISQSKNNGYDTYDSAVVVAKSTTAARKIYPSGSAIWKNGEWCWETMRGEERYHAYCWVQHIDDVEVEYIGSAGALFTEPQVLVASFNAG